MKNKAIKDRRFYKRYILNNKSINVYSYGVEDKCILKNISEEGICFISSNQYYKSNDLIKIQFLNEIKNDFEVITAEYKIIRIFKQKEKSYEIACKIVSISPYSNFIYKYICNLEAQNVASILKPASRN